LQTRSPALTATELREKLLREKVMALRKSNNAVKEQNPTNSSKDDEGERTRN
jgi:hypothetical protein